MSEGCLGAFCEALLANPPTCVASGGFNAFSFSFWVSLVSGVTLARDGARRLRGNLGIRGTYLSKADHELVPLRNSCEPTRLAGTH